MTSLCAMSFCHKHVHSCSNISMDCSTPKSVAVNFGIRLSQAETEGWKLAKEEGLEIGTTGPLEASCGLNVDYHPAKYQGCPLSMRPFFTCLRSLLAIVQSAFCCSGLMSNSSTRTVPRSFWSMRVFMLVPGRQCALPAYLLLSPVSIIRVTAGVILLISCYFSSKLSNTILLYGSHTFTSG